MIEAKKICYSLLLPYEVEMSVFNIDINVWWLPQAIFSYVRGSAYI